MSSNLPLKFKHHNDNEVERDCYIGQELDTNFDYDDVDDRIVLMLRQKSRQREHFERAINYVSFEVSTTATADDSLFPFQSRKRCATGKIFHLN